MQTSVLHATGLRWLLAAALATLILAVHLPATHDEMLYDDAADYMRAAEPPLQQTWLDSDSQSLTSLIRMRRGNADFARHPWDYLYSINDNMALRHFHSPLSYYAMSLVWSLGGGAHAERVLAAIVSSLACLVLFLFLTRLRVPTFLAAGFTLYAGVQSRFVEPSVDPSPHAWYMGFCPCALGYFALYIERRQTPHLYGAVLASAAAFATLEFTVLLFATFCIATLLLRLQAPDAQVAVPGHLAGRSVLMFFAFTFLLWPGGWLKGGYLLNYGVLMMQMLFHHQSAFALGDPLTPGSVYRTVLGYDLLLPLLCGLWLPVALILFVRRKLSTAGLVFSVYTLCAFTLAGAARFRLSTYISEFVFFLIASSAIVGENTRLEICRQFPALQRTPQLIWRLAAAVILVAGSTFAWRQRGSVWGQHPNLRPVMNSVRATVPSGDVILVSKHRETLALNLPQYHFERTVSNNGMPLSAERAIHAHYLLLDSTISPPPRSMELARFAVLPEEAMILWRR